MATMARGRVPMMVFLNDWRLLYRFIILFLNSTKEIVLKKKKPFYSEIKTGVNTT